MFDKMIALLESFGLLKSDNQPDELSDDEYAVFICANKRMITLGKGKNGDDGCHMAFYFTIDSGEYLYHGIFEPEA